MALYGVKWRNFKMVLYLQKELTEPALKLATPHVINLIVDPKERKAIDLPYIHSWTAAHFGKIMKRGKRETRVAHSSRRTAGPCSCSKNLGKSWTSAFGSFRT